MASVGFTIEKPKNSSVLFLDTFAWRMLVHDWNDEMKRLEDACRANLITVAMSQFVAAELTNRRTMDDVKSICGDALIIVPTGRVLANQLVAAMIAFIHEMPEVKLTWDAALFDPPLLVPPSGGLKGLAEAYAKSLNDVRAAQPKKHDKVATIADALRSLWAQELEPYWSVYEREGVTLPTDARSQFFLSPYFEHLPAVILEVYLFATLLHEHDAEVNDVIDIQVISELLPYATLFVMDKDQHSRLRKAERQLPASFTRLERVCCVASGLGDPKPKAALRSFLKWVEKSAGMPT
jgi:hypothetical protein